ncbi:MAG: GDSL-type esterase/lipase family protein, partial [Planctomycetota bacterium]|nr:GDSL-type esterase/lipase family protein [Planctomycetota bacterium]
LLTGSVQPTLYHEQSPATADPATYLLGLRDEMTKRWPRNRTINIVCHGHSVPAGYFKTPTVDTFNAYPHLLHVALKKRFPHAVINVIVTSVGGEESERGSKRFDRDVLSMRPDLITIDYGLNDRRLGLQRSRKAMESMLKTARKNKIPVILLTPTADQRSKLTDPKDPLTQQAEFLRKLAATHRVGLADSFAAFLTKIAAGKPLAKLMSQSNHPNRAGHELVVNELLKWFPSAKKGP